MPLGTCKAVFFWFTIHHLPEEPKELDAVVEPLLRCPRDLGVCHRQSSRGPLSHLLSEEEKAHSTVRRLLFHRVYSVAFLFTF